MSSLFSAKKLLLLGLIVIILVAIPLSVYIAQQQQKTKSLAAQSTHLFFNPSRKDATAIDQTVKFDIMIDPTAEDPPNEISFAKLVINYDPSVLSIDETGFVLTKAFSTVLEEPIFSPGSIIVILSVGADPSNAIRARTKIADASFKVLAETASTQITFANGTQVLSVSSGDKAGENVLARTTPATVSAKSSGTSPTPTPTPTPSQNVTTQGPTPTQKPGTTPPVDGEFPEITPLQGDEPTPTQEPTPTPEEIVVITPPPTIEPTGPTDNLIGIGIVALIISVVSAILLFVF